MIVQKAYKFRVYPNHSQQAELAKQFGAVRFVYNHYRVVREGFYLDTGTGLNYNAPNGHPAMDLADILKVDYPWLKEADSQTLQQALKDLDRAYKNFFAGRAGYPTFHSKHDKQSIRYPQRFKVKAGAHGARVYLPKVGWVKCVFHRAIEGDMKNCTVSKTKSGRYFISIQVETEAVDPTPQTAAIAIDLGLTTFATLSNEDKHEKPKHLYRSERRLKIRQRRFCPEHRLNFATFGRSQKKRITQPFSQRIGRDQAGVSVDARTSARIHVGEKEVRYEYWQT